MGTLFSTKLQGKCPKKRVKTRDQDGANGQVTCLSENMGENSGKAVGRQNKFKNPNKQQKNRKIRHTRIMSLKLVTDM